MSIRNKHCLICHSSQLKPLVGYYQKHELITCQSCGFVFMEKIPSLSELSTHYSTYSYNDQGYLSSLTRKSYQRLLDEFEKYRKTNTLLDVGCGRGWFLEEAKKRGWEVYGTEYSETAVNLCRAKGIQMVAGKLDALTFLTKNFDVITSFEVIEHINNPNEELENINKLLRSGGLFYCTTPNFNSLLRYYLKADYNMIGYPEHLSYYTKKTLNRVVQQNGFKNIKFLSTGISITRIKTSKKTSTEKLISEKSADEILRQTMDSKWYLRVAKSIANGVLTRLNLGVTLKGYYIKS